MSASDREDDNNDNDDNNYGRHTDEGSGGEHIKERHIDDKNSERGYIKEETCIKDEEEGIYDVFNRE